MCAHCGVPALAWALAAAGCTGVPGSGATTCACSGVAGVAGTTAAAAVAAGAALSAVLLVSAASVAAVTAKPAPALATTGVAAMTGAGVAATTGAGAVAVLVEAAGDCGTAEEALGCAVCADAAPGMVCWRRCHCGIAVDGTLGMVGEANWRGFRSMLLIDDRSRLQQRAAREPSRQKAGDGVRRQGVREVVHVVRARACVCVC